MTRRSDSIVLILCGTALFATLHLCRSTSTDHRATESIDGHNEAVADFDSLVKLFQAEIGQSATDDFSIPPAVATAAEISDADRAEILNRVLADVLENPDFQDSRDFYGTTGKQSAVIVTGSDVKFPPDFKASVSGWNIESRNAGDEPDPDSPRIVAIRFDKFAPHKPAQYLFDGHVTVCIFNGGGNPDGNIHIGGCFAFYRVETSNGKWTAQCVFAKDP